jgi:hypothetical protein
MMPQVAAAFTLMWEEQQRYISGSVWHSRGDESEMTLGVRG